MTTEIAIMNKSAIALAADSAVTITLTGPKRKTYKVLNSASKLFALSKYAPVGLMIYGNGSMLGIPWETIVKIYRDDLQDKQFPSLLDYCNDFFGFLDRFEVSAEVEEQYVVDVAVSSFSDLRKQIDLWVNKEIQAKKQLSPKQVKTKLGNLIKDRYNDFLKLGEQSVLSKTKRSNLRKKYRSAVNSIVKSIFEKLPIDRHMASQLLTIAVNTASVGPPNQSGIVIAGFGTKDLYPHCQNYDVTGVFAGKTIKRDGKPEAIRHEMGAAIMSFAQDDDVRTFMEGVAPTLMTFLKNSFYGIMTESLPDRLSNEISTKLGLTDQQKKELCKVAGDMCKGACDSAFQQLLDQQQMHYIKPVIEATKFLNKSELAAMAETLVNLVTFRKQVTMEAETVGGPIDVAVITKGDGLVWIKRKNYFPPELNHQFFSKYYRRVDINDQGR